MTREELAQLIESIRTAENELDRNNLLLALDADYTTMLETVQTHAETIDTLTAQNQEYVKQNNALWLKISTPTKEDVEEETEEVAEKLKYEDLEF